MTTDAYGNVIQSDVDPGDEPASRLGEAMAVDEADTAATAARTGPGYGYGGATATLAGGLASAYAQFAAGRANKKIARFNANYAKQQADQAIQAGRFTANRVAAHEAQIQGAGRAAAASSGVVAGAGSQHFIAASNQAAADADQRNIMLNARRQAYGYQIKAAGDTLEGRMAERSGDVSAAQTLLNTGSRMWMQSNQNDQIVFT